MNKQELIQAIADKAIITHKDAKTALNAVLDSIKEALVKGDEVNLVGFGSFKIKHTQARTGRNPHTGEAVQIPAKKAVSFKAGKGLKEVVKGA